MAKTFKKPPVEQFITTEQPQQIQEAPAGETPPAGYEYTLVRQKKSERMQLLLRPAVKEAIKKKAAQQGVSMNDLVNNVLEEYIERGKE